MARTVISRFHRRSYTARMRSVRLPTAPGLCAAIRRPRRGGGRAPSWDLVRRASLKRTVPESVKWAGGAPPPDVEEEDAPAPASTFARMLAPPPAPVSEPVHAAPVAAVKLEEEDEGAANEPAPRQQEHEGPVRVVAPSIREVVVEGRTGILTLPPCRTDHVARRFRIMLIPMDD